MELKNKTLNLILMNRHIFSMLILTILFSGCLSSKQIQSELDKTHREAYQDWERQREVRKDSAKAGRKLTVTAEQQKQQPLLSGELTLNDALKFSLLYNRNLEQAIEQKTAAKGRILSSYGNVTPNITVNGVYNRREEVNAFEVGEQRIQLGALDNYSATLSVEQPLFDGGGLFAGMRAAKLFRVLTDENIKGQAEGVIFQTENSYLQTLMLQEQYLVAQGQVELSQALLEDVQNKQKYGAASEFNVLRAQVELSNARSTMIRIKNNLEQAQANLLKTMGVSQNSNITLQDSLQFDPIEISEHEAVEQALLNRPDLAASQLSVQLQQEAVTSAYSDYFPSISAYFDNTWAKPSPVVQTLNQWDRIWNAGLTVRWNLFNLNREGRILQEKSALRQQQITYLDTKEQVLYEVHSAILSLENARENVEAQQLTLQQAREGLRLAEAGFREGTLSQVEVLDARQSLTEAQFNYYNSLFTYEVAKLDLNRTTGQLSINVEERVGEQIPGLPEN